MRTTIPSCRRTLIASIAGIATTASCRRCSARAVTSASTTAAAAPGTTAPSRLSSSGRSAFLEPARRVDGAVGEDAVGARALHADQALQDHAVVEPAPLAGGLQQGVLAAHLICEARHADALLHPA